MNWLDNLAEKRKNEWNKNNFNKYKNLIMSIFTFK